MTFSIVAECCYAECRHYAECRLLALYAECRYAECRHEECCYAECCGTHGWSKLQHHKNINAIQALEFETKSQSKI